MALIFFKDGLKKNKGYAAETTGSPQSLKVYYVALYRKFADLCFKHVKSLSKHGCLWLVSSTKLEQVVL